MTLLRKSQNGSAMAGCGQASSAASADAAMARDDKCFGMLGPQTHVQV
jgi:hypothetical protein